MTNHRKGFTLSEILVVMGIIVLFVSLAVPTIRTMTSSSDISSTRNNIAALLTRAREEAISLQAVRGVLFFNDRSTNRLVGVIVQQAVIQDPNIPNVVLLDAVPNRDSMPLPLSVGLQTVFNGLTPANSQSTTPTDDRYLGFNPLAGSSPPINVGGVILFDGNGKLISRPYGFQMSQPPPSGTTTVASNLCNMLRVNYGSIITYADVSNPISGLGSNAFVPGSTGSAPTRTLPANPLCSQVGLILFDRNAFHSLGFTDQDADLQSGQTYTSPWPLVTGGIDGDGVHSERDEEAWLDTNCTPLMVNRYDGTLILAE